MIYLNDTINQIKDNFNNFYILYTGWKTEEKIFENIFPESFVIRYELENDKIDYYEEKYKNIQIDDSNIHKSLRHVITGYYIKKKCISTLKKFYEKTNIKFDLIVTIRCDTIIYNNKKIDYKYILDNGLNNVYVPTEIDWNMYGVGAYAVTLSVGNYKNTKILCDHINFLDVSVLPNTNIIHPETAIFLYYKYRNLNIKRLNLKSFAWVLDHNNNWIKQYNNE